MQAMAAAIGATAGRAESSGAKSSRLEKSAREFEAMLLQSWLEKMNQSFAGVDKSQDAAHDTVSSLGTQAIAKALAARGGIGIAEMILRQVHPKKPESGASGPVSPREADPQLNQPPGGGRGKIKVFSPIADH